MQVTLSGDALFGIDTIGDPMRMRAAAALPQTVSLGRVRPAALPMVPHFSRFFSEEAMSAPPPPSINRRDKAKKSLSRMLRNDVQGCCVISGKYHNLGVWSANDTDSGGEVQPTDAEVDAHYRRLKAGPGDSGCVITHVLDYMRSTGFTISGRPYKIDGYVACDHRSKVQTQVVQVLFGASTIGINLPQSWTQAAVWDVTNSRIVGGHDVSPIDYDERGVYVSSWGRIYLMTWAAWTRQEYIEEFYSMLSPLWYGNDRLAPSGVDFTKLKLALEQLAVGTLPDLPNPIDPPTPPPVEGKLYRHYVGPDGTLTFKPV